MGEIIMLSKILEKVPAKLQEQLGKEENSESISEKYDRLSRMRVQAYNEKSGALTGYECERCRNKGYIAKIDDGKEIMCECVCMEIRRSMKRIINSGLIGMLDSYSFDTYKTDDSWQKRIKQSAIAYANNPQGWFFIGGAVGCGKTHICTAICSQLMDQGIPVRYMLWRDEIVELKSIVNEPEYQEKIWYYKTVKCLYIDDFLKAGRGKITEGDLNVAFEILNYRYNRQDLITIISSEKTVEQILDTDEAVGSRIYQRTKNHYFAVSGQDKNWRMR